MKRLNGNYIFVPRIFWLSVYERENDEPLVKYYKLSTNAKWLYMTLKEIEHRYTGIYNNEDYCREHGFVNDKNRFTMDNVRLGAIAGMSKQTLEKAKRELKEAGLIEVEYSVTKTGSVCAYRLTDGIDFDKEPQKVKWTADKKKRNMSEYRKPKKEENRTGYIYVMKNCGYYKIGKSINCKRLGEYTKLPEDPEYVIIKHVRYMDEIEKSLHNHFDGKRQRSGSCEWFDLNEKDLKKIELYLNRYEIKGEETEWYDEYVLNSKK